MRLLYALPLLAGSLTAGQATFNKDVLPILQKNCQGCHRPGEAAPFSLLTYTEARPWAKAIRESVRLKRMPPWFADPHVGKFANDRSLTQPDIDTLAAWADSGAAEGDSKDAPAPVKHLTGWNIGEPDLVLEMPAEYHVPATGTIDYTYFVVPTGFTEDKWVRFAEVRPGNRKVVHHVIAFIREPGSKWLAGAVPGKPFVPGKSDREGDGLGQILVGYAPGTVPVKFDEGQARLVKAGSDIVLQLHYTADGKEQTDRSKIGMVFAKEPPTQRVITMAALNTKFVIPPGVADHKVTAEIILKEPTTLTALIPHMHLRGKAFEYRVVYPTGETQELLRVPKYDFNWQLTYVPEKALRCQRAAASSAPPGSTTRPTIRTIRTHGRQFAMATRVGKR